MLDCHSEDTREPHHASYHWNPVGAGGRSSTCGGFRSIAIGEVVGGREGGQHRAVSGAGASAGAKVSTSAAIGGTTITIGSGDINLFFIMELLGVIIMCLGFLRTKEVFGLYRFPLVHGFNRVSADSQS